MAFTPATKAEIILGTASDFEDLIQDLIEAERTDLIEPMEAMGIDFPLDTAGNLMLCSCRRKAPAG